MSLIVEVSTRLTDQGCVVSGTAAHGSWGLADHARLSVIK